MARAVFHFHLELNDFLLPRMKGREVVYQFTDRASIKDAIESLGVPHTEVEAIFVNEQTVDFTYLVRDGDRIEVYPFSAPEARSARVSLRPPAPLPLRFVLDVHLGRLAAYLRLLGFDTLYRNDYTDEELARIAGDEKRVLLTRDRGVLKRSVVVYGYWLRATDSREQLVEVLQRFSIKSIKDSGATFTRCMECNGLLVKVAKEEIDSRLPPRTREHYADFHRCTDCGRIYWQGSHYKRMREFVERLMLNL